MVEKECPICAYEEEKFIVCQFCSFEYCVDCFTKHLLSLKVLFPFCMNCKHVFDLDFIAMNTVPNFHNKKYRDHRAKILVEHEKSLLPQTQEAANKQKKIREVKYQIGVLNARIKESERLYHILIGRAYASTFDAAQNRNVYVLTYQEQNEAIANAKAELARSTPHLLQRNLLKRQMNDLLYLTPSGNIEKKKYNIEFIGRCPETNCEGFITRKEKGVVVCGLCDTEFCSKCHKHNNKEHECKAEDVSTVEELKKTTKPCPKCAALIFKISGCSQMFCTVCKTAFDWQTGEIVTKNFHNPHFFEWQRQAGVVPPPRDTANDEALARAIAEGREEEFQLLLAQGGQCQTLNVVTFLNAGYNENGNFPKNKRENLYRQMSEFKGYTQHKFQNIETCDNEDLRISYLLKEIDDKHLLKMVKMREKKREKHGSIHLILQMYCDTLNDMLIKSTFVYNNDKVIRDIVKEIKALRKFVSDSLNDVQKRFGGVVPSLAIAGWE